MGSALRYIAAIYSPPTSFRDSICGTLRLEEGHRIEERLPRKLTVILHADVVGSTKLVLVNDTMAHQRTGRIPKGLGSLAKKKIKGRKRTPWNKGVEVARIDFGCVYLTRKPA